MTEIVVRPGQGHGWADFEKDWIVIGDWFDTHLLRKPASEAK